MNEGNKDPFDIWTTGLTIGQTDSDLTLSIALCDMVGDSDPDEACAEISANVITLHVTDALRGDDVLTQDSMVIDLGAPSFTVGAADDDDDGGGGGGGCFLDTLRF
jgi:hypothetical protein